MKQITKEQQKRKDALDAELSEKRAALEKAIEKYNEVCATAFTEVQLAVDNLNAELNAARELRDEVVSDIDSFTSDKSEKWQESDAASAYAEWHDAWESLELDDIEIGEPEPLEVPDFSEDFESVQLTKDG